MRTVAIIPAGGAGKRLKSYISKQYLLLDSLPVLVHTLKVFQASEIIDEIILALPSEDIIHIRQELAEKYGLTKVVNAVAGGNERQDSVKNCLSAIKGKCGIVVIHDAVRPFVSDALIEKVVNGAKHYGAAVAGVKMKDTVKETRGDHFVKMTVPREDLWLAQTPQAFEFDLIEEAYKSAYRENFYGTDDASLIERIGKKVKMIESSHENIKITTRDDMEMADALMKKRNRFNLRSGLGYDSHRFASDRKLVLGGVSIPYEKGLRGHSDADALIHALCDALLGAAGAGDIGRHFPDTDPEYKDISSMIILKEVKKIIQSKGFSINNVDATVIMEEPRLSPYADKIVSNIARVLNIPKNYVSVKAKTNEGMGFAGKKEGIAVLAIATVAERKVDE